MLNAVEIQKIAQHHDSTDYQEGSIFTFCNSDSEKYTLDNVFGQDEADKFYKFLAFSVLITKYLYNYFYDITKPGAQIMIDKWAFQKRFVFSIKPVVDEKSKEGKLNHAFASSVKDQHH